MVNQDTDVRRGTIAHEMGHTFGLKDINKTDSIMHYSINNATTNKVSKDANDAIVKKY